MQDAKPLPIRYASYCGTLLHYAQDGQPAFRYGLDQRSAFEVSELALVPRMNLRHTIQAKRGSATKQACDPCWRADAEASAQTAVMASASTCGALAAVQVPSLSTGTPDRSRCSGTCSDARSPPARRRRH